MNVKILEHALHKENLLTQSELNDMGITSITYDSRKVAPGCLFICKGAAFKREYLLSAIEKGAVAYLSQTDYDVCIPGLIVSDIRKAMAVITACFYGNPAESLDILGITGTKGKTTVAFLTRAMLRAGNQNYGMLSSVLTDTGASSLPSHLTTPESPDLQCMFGEMRDFGLPGAIMEVSSQGLAYDRVYGVKYAASVFLNIGQDHISPIEHRTFEEYFDAKKRIFALSDCAYINCDDEYAPEMMESAMTCRCKIRTFGFSSQADIRAYDLYRDGNLTKFRVKCKEFDRQFTLPMIGAFNVYNALASICLCMGRITPTEMVKGMRHAVVPGRMEVLQGDGLTVIVDYAHNKMSLETLLSDLRKEYVGQRIVCLFGCPGGKAYLRRADMGEVAGRLADYTIITADDPDREDVSEICHEIAEHINDANGKYEIVTDRIEAVKTAILDAREGDVIVLAGKGVELHQKVDGSYQDYPGDLPLAKKFLRIRMTPQN